MPPTPEIFRLQAESDIRSAYDSVLLTSFPEQELGEFAAVNSSIKSGGLTAFGTREPSGSIAAMIGVEVRGPVAMIAYLAIAPAGRGGGIGGALLDHAVRYAREEAGADYVLIEVERPDHHVASPQFGDPERRLQFYARRGLEVLDVPYFVPSLRPGGDRTPALLLGAMWVSPAARTPGGIVAAPVLAFIRDYFVAAEGGFGFDEPSVAIMQALSSDTVAMWPAAQYWQAPVGLLPGSLRQRPDAAPATQ